MARKVFMSVLGTGFYYPCVYQGRKSSTETRFIQEATLKEVGADQWSENDCVYILLTQEARKKNWDKNITERSRNNNSPREPYSGLELALENMKLPCQVKDVEISDGKNESEMWDIFEKVYDLLKEGDELYFDLTHGFRYLPMFLLVLGNYAKFLRKTQVVYMSYGNYEAREKYEKDPNKDVAPIVDLLPLAVLQDWTFAAGQFLRSGNADEMSELGKKRCADIKKELKRRDLDTESLNSYLATVQNLSEKLALCRGVDLIKAEDIAKMRAYQNDVKEETIPAFGPLISKITDSFAAFRAERNTANAYFAAQWCLKKGLYQQAMTFLREVIVTVIADRNGLNIVGEDERKLVEDAFWNANNKDFEKFDGRLRSDPALNNSEIVVNFKHFRDLRNDLNHSGMRPNPAATLSLKRNIEQAMSFFGPIVTSSTNEGRISECYFPPIFINYSNHPSEKWPQAQLEAAKEFGPVVDIPFRSIDPEADSAQIKKAVEEEAENIRAKAKGKKAVVHIMGEMTLTYALVRKLKEAGIRCVASTTSRVCCENADGSKTSQFNFVKFRDYE